MTKVVSIKSHPKYRDHASLRQYLAGGQDNFGTKVNMDDFFDLDNPEVQHQLKELNLWCEALKDIGPGVFPKPKLMDLSDVILVPISMEPHLVKNLHPSQGVDFSHYLGRDPGKSLTTDKMLAVMFPGGLSKGDFYDIRALPTNPYDVLREGVNIVIENKMQYMVRGRDDANPTS
jgi:hypothetical protein